MSPLNVPSGITSLSLTLCQEGSVKDLLKKWVEHLLSGRFGGGINLLRQGALSSLLSGLPIPKRANYLGLESVEYIHGNISIFSLFLMKLQIKC